MQKLSITTNQHFYCIKHWNALFALWNNTVTCKDLWKNLETKINANDLLP